MTATDTQHTTQTTCTAGDESMTPGSTGEWITCPNGKGVFLNSYLCCDAGLFFEIGGVVDPAVAFGRPRTGFMTPTVTREVAEGIARMLADEGLDDAMSSTATPSSSATWVAASRHRRAITTTSETTCPDCLAVGDLRAKSWAMYRPRAWSI